MTASEDASPKRIAASSSLGRHQVHIAMVAMTTAFTRASGHSLRRGLATAARREGRSLDSIQRQARHKNLNTTIGYVDTEELELAENASEGIGL